MRLIVPFLTLALAAVSCLGCGSNREVIVATGQGRRATSDEIDADPWALLPGGAVGWARLDARALFAAPYGREASHLLSERLPLARDSGLDPEKDVEEIFVGMYATVGSDLAAIARGSFDAVEIAQAIQQSPLATHGRRIVTHQFAGFDVFVLEEVAMVPVTNRSLVFGTQLGVRRVLERIEEGRLARSLPNWFENMLNEEQAEFALGVDLDAQPVPAALRSGVPAFEGIRAARLLGNFGAPGLNLAGTLTFDRPDSARAAADYLLEQKRSLNRASVLLQLLQVPQPIHRLEAQAVDKDTQIAAELDARAIEALLARSEQVLQQWEN